MKKSVKYTLLFGLAVILTACSGEGKPRTEYDVLMTEFAFSPSDFIVPAGKEITLNLTNNGAVVHDFVIFKYGTSPGDQYNEEDLPNVYWMEEVLPGGEVSITFTAPTQPGEYVVTCGIQGHLEAGMSAKLTVLAEE